VAARPHLIETATAEANVMPTRTPFPRVLATTTAALVLLGAGGGADCASAERCSCLWTFVQPVAERVRLQRAASDLLFRGTVVDTVRSAEGDGFARLAVAEWWHGASFQSLDTVSVRVYAAAMRHNCEITLEVGREYLVFADRDSAGVARTSVCSGTRRADGSGPELSALGPGVSPQEIRAR
jgi:hypothetical protein